MSLLQYLDTFLSTLCTWRVRSSRRKEFFKKGILKKFTTFTGKHLHRVLAQNLVEVLCCEFCKIFKDIYFAKVCEDLPLKNKISTGVYFRKILDFYYKWNFYYEGTSLYVPLTILERANKIIFQTSFEFLVLSIAEQTKTCSNSTTKECFRDVIWLFLYLAWKIFLKYMMESKFFKSWSLYINSWGVISNGFCF